MIQLIQKDIKKDDLFNYLKNKTHKLFEGKIIIMVAADLYRNPNSR